VLSGSRNATVPDMVVVGSEATELAAGVWLTTGACVTGACVTGACVTGACVTGAAVAVAALLLQAAEAAASRRAAPTAPRVRREEVLRVLITNLPPRSISLPPGMRSPQGALRHPAAPRSGALFGGQEIGAVFANAPTRLPGLRPPVPKGPLLGMREALGRVIAILITVPVTVRIGLFGSFLTAIRPYRSRSYRALTREDQRARERA
jgi:hypothetical protein